MGLETASFLEDLVATNPDGGTDNVAAGDDHIRLLKTVLKATLAGNASDLYDEAVTVGPDVLNTQTKHKLDGTTAPTVNEDSGDGYGVGSMWLDVTNDEIYVCIDATAAAAIWRPIGPTLMAKQATTSGDNWTFAIPAWAKKITLLGVGVSLDGSTDSLIARVGTTTLGTTGYLGTTSNADGSSINSPTNSIRISAANASAAGIWHFSVNLYLSDAATNTWVYDVSASKSNTTGVHHGAGSVALASALDIVGVLSGGTTDDGDAGFVSCQYI